MKNKNESISSEQISNALVAESDRNLFCQNQGLYQKPPLDSDLTGYSGAFEETGITINTLYAMVHRKKIPHIRLTSRLVRFSRKELRAWMKSHQVEVQ